MPGVDLNLRPEPLSDDLGDQELVQRVLSGNQRAFAALMRRYNQRLFRIARGVLRDPAEAEDAVQEAYLKAYRNLAGFRGPAGFPAWLSTIVLNEARGRLRRRTPLLSIEAAEMSDKVIQLESLASRRPDPESAASAGQLGELLDAAIDDLPHDFRLVFLLRAVERLSVRETAEHLDIPPATVKTRYHRARKLLRDNLGRRLDDLLPTRFAFAGQRCDRVVASVLARIERGEAGRGPA